MAVKTAWDRVASSPLPMFYGAAPSLRPWPRTSEPPPDSYCKRPKSKSRGAYNSHRWTRQEERYLVRMRLDERATWREIALHFGRSEQACSRKFKEIYLWK